MHRMNHMAGWARDVAVRFVFGVVSEEHPYQGSRVCLEGSPVNSSTSCPGDRRGLLASKSRVRLISQGRTLE